jgi:rubrerythrin
MSNAAVVTGTGERLALVFQYTIEAYKVFQKLAESLPNPMAAALFKGLALDERKHRDLLDIRYAATEGRIGLTLGADLRFQDPLEGELSFRELTEMLIARERTMERKLVEFSSGGDSDDDLFRYIAASKRAHLVYLERELELIRRYPDWYKREDGESLIVSRGAE